MAAVDHGRGKDGTGKIGRGGWGITYLFILFVFPLLKAEQQREKEGEDDLIYTKECWLIRHVGLLNTKH